MQPLEQIERECQIITIKDDELGFAAWKQRMRNIVRVRAMKVHIADREEFAARVQAKTGIGRTQAYAICQHKIAEQPVIGMIWNDVITGRHKAKIAKQAYVYPSYNKMINDFAPKDTGKAGAGAGKAGADADADDADADGDDAIGSNDPRKRGTILRSEQMLTDQVRTLISRATTAETLLKEAQRDLETSWVKQRDAASAFANLRADFNAAKRASEAALAEKDAEIARLKALHPQAPPDEDGPDDDGGGDDGGGEPVISGLGGGDDGRPIPFRPYIVPKETAAPQRQEPVEEEPPTLPPDLVDQYEQDQYSEESAPAYPWTGGKPQARHTPPDPPPDLVTPPDPQAPEHPQEREFTIADMTATEIDAKWSALEKMSGGGRMHDRPGALVARVKTYALLHHRPEQMAFAAAAILNNRSISFFAQITPQMGLDQILRLPEKPKKPAKE